LFRIAQAVASKRKKNNKKKNKKEERAIIRYCYKARTKLAEHIVRDIVCCSRRSLKANE